MTVYESLRSKPNFKNMNSCKLHKIQTSPLSQAKRSAFSSLSLITELSAVVSAGRDIVAFPFSLKVAE